MKIYPIAAESLGTRSFAHLVVTGSVNILIDPSVSLSPKRFSLKPLPIELAAAWVSRQLILEFAEMVDIIIQTHYHADHYTLGITRRYEFTNEEIFHILELEKIEILENDDSKTTWLDFDVATDIIQAHGGEIWVKAVPEDGTTFHIRLPRPLNGVKLE